VKEEEAGVLEEEEEEEEDGDGEEEDDLGEGEGEEGGKGGKDSWCTIA